MKQYGNTDKKYLKLTSEVKTYDFLIKYLKILDPSI